MGVHPLCEGHCPGVTYDLLDHGLIYMSLRQLRDAGVPGIMGLVVETKLLHKWGKIAVIVIPIVEVLLIRCVQEIFTLRSIEPCFVERE